MIPFLAHIWINVAWIVELSGFLVLLIATDVLLRRIFDRYKKRNRLQQGDWRYHLDQALLTPFRTLLWILFMTFAIDLIIRQFELEQISSNPSAFRKAGIVICMTWFLFRWKSLLEQAVESRRRAGKKTIDPASVEIVGKIFTIATLFISALILLQIFGMNIAPLLAFGGIGAAVLGFASKDVISNFYGGLTVYLTRPFSVNDFIELPQKKIMGTIERVGWYFTTLRDLSKKPFYIPNAIFTTELVVNRSRMTHQYINEVLSLRYDDAGKLDSLIREIRLSLSKDPEIDQTEPIHVYLTSLGQSSLQLEVRAYTKTTTYQEHMEIKQKILIQICELVQRFGATIGYPVREVHLHPLTTSELGLSQGLSDRASGRP